MPGGLHHACITRLQLESPLARVGRRALSRTNQGKGPRGVPALIVSGGGQPARPLLQWSRITSGGPRRPHPPRRGHCSLCNTGNFASCVWSRTRGGVRVPRNTVGQFIAVLGIILLILLILQFV